ncbi:cobalamin-5'-phosphate synthase [Paenibacillus sp. UNCCL117]|uniref:adenosylcobinamide-GDP ribazoletransferase n=1 Tax=unclassified Paenibacillus TaxID=185978 RepID=UPI0008920B7B|nr:MULTISPECIES: adenosylcobinamide-GDP ribazoletransferase [unclassified Paenibacillus]SDC00807.1 cobalamin-5'-phosphate synthase [Paenibacillus sp. cl123]SFW36444.1 cobalamin-5'-phosphate synthase [Paenibacillus sp. UNCCL117]
MGAAARVIKEAGAACAAALQFLTRLPVPVKLDYHDALFRRSVIFYPLAGWLLGTLTAAFGVLLADVLELPASVTAALTLGCWVALSGALHLDGLMDTADGVLSHRSRERMLEIMKDSRVGAMGVIVCVLVLLLKWTLLAELLPESGSVGASSWLLLPLVTLWSRWFMAAAIWGWPYARSRQASGTEDGTGTGINSGPANSLPSSSGEPADASSGSAASGGLGGLFQGTGLRHVLAAAGLAMLLTCAAIAVPSALDWLSLTAGQGLGLVLGMAAGAVVAGSAMAAYLNSKLGGLTGDTYGAINELLEAGLLLIIVMLAV